MFCTSQLMDAETVSLRHTTSHLANRNKRSISMGIRWLGGRSLHTNRSIAQISVGGCIQCRVSSVVIQEELPVIT